MNTKHIFYSLLIASAVGISACNSNNAGSSTLNSSETSGEIPEPMFRKDGELRFLKKDGSEISKIEIEIAKDEQERAQGLMYRKSMPETRGMLFLFDKSEPQNFWMKNTFISLDIIYADQNKEIVTIRRNAEPLNITTQELGSGKAAQYVIETLGGYCDKHGVNEGDVFSYQ